MSEPNVEEMARALLEERLQPVRSLTAATHQVERARQELATAERNRADQWKAAVSAGWSEAELRRLGLKAPQRRSTGRPGGRPKKTQQQQEENTEQQQHPTP